MKIEKALSRHLTALRGINLELSRDTVIAGERLKGIIEGWATGNGDLETTAFWIRAAIKAFMAQVEGLSFWMRNATLEMAEDAGLYLTNQNRADLSELKYDKSSDTIIQELFSKGPKTTVKLAFRYFPMLFGANWKLNTNDPGWADFLEVLRWRNRVAHPTRIEYFYPAKVPANLFPAILWFHSSVLDMFEACAACVGLSSQKSRESLDLTPWRTISVPEVDPGPGFYEKIEEHGSNSLAYVDEIFRLVHSDVTRALDLLSESLSKSHVVTPLAAFSARNAARSIFAGLEGMTCACKLFSFAAEKRREVTLSNEEHAELETKDECEKAAFAATNIFKILRVWLTSEN